MELETSGNSKQALLQNYDFSGKGCVVAADNDKAFRLFKLAIPA
jgi:hypothetical protein